MAIIFGKSGSEKALIKELQKLGVYSFSKLDDVENHINTSNKRIQDLKNVERNSIYTNIEKLKQDLNSLVQNKNSRKIQISNDLSEEIKSLNERIEKLSIVPKNIFMQIISKLLLWKSKRRLNYLENNFDMEIERLLSSHSKNIIKIEKEINYLETNIELEIENRLKGYISEKNKIDRSLEYASNYLIGSRGEREVINSLYNLPDTFIVINDVNFTFSPPLKTNDGLRFKCQTDHIVVGPPGVFNIETKYWSNKSIENNKFKSPIEQIRISGKGIWRELHNAIRNREIKIKGSFWDIPKIPVRNVLAMVGSKPNAEYQYVKLISAQQLPHYINYFEPILTKDEIESIANWLKRIS